ncbi:MAG: lipid A export permease/ATP-binding protein MsbA [Desulfobacterales bacterium]|jgi:subfamily B ATP-binding cassette protein MsbA|nr:lipid A export permease/ATP-binding protein MsbA [Desulfobacterales bacterium]OEU59859.1 MAG: lipid A export permease/ATP-binding protein MsbA [Desulfobacterales bacterium C00003104]
MKKKIKQSDIEILKRLFPVVKVYSRRLVYAMLCMIGVAGTTSAMAFLFKPVIDDIFINKDAQMLTLLPLAIIGTFILKGACYYGQAYMMNHVGQCIVKRIRDDLYSHIQTLSLSFFFRNRTGVLMSRITNDVNLVKGMLSEAVTGVIKDFFTIICLLFVVFYRDWKLACIAITIFPMAVIPIVRFGRRLRRASTGCQEALADINVQLHETFTGQRIVKSFGMEDYEDERFGEKTVRVFRNEIRAVRVRALSPPVMDLLGAAGVALIIWYGGHNVIKGVSTPGTFFSFMAAVLMLYEPVKKISGLNNILQEGLAAAVRIYDILDTGTEIKEKDNAEDIPIKKHSVTFRNVSFKYGDDLILKDINLHVTSGEALALVGISGGGKTSLVNLIPRFYDVCEGSIMIDDTDIRDITLASLRRQIAIVTQDIVLFNNSIRNNIAYGNLKASEEEIVLAARAAYAYDFIRALPNGFDTTVGEMGARLSGGEKQRICIARAILKDSPILILDEATSALDTESELAVQKALENLMKGRTTFVIAHRLSTIRHADRIIVIVGGKIVEEGRHEELLAQKGEYFKLHELQFKNDK